MGMIIVVWLISTQPMVSHSAETEKQANPNIAKVVKLIISASSHPYLTRADITKHHLAINKLYALSQFQLVWLNSINRSDPAEKALRLLASATESGLSVQDYDGKSLRWQWYRIVAGQITARNELALFDIALSVSVLRYLSDLHFGRVNPWQVKFRVDAKTEQPDFAQIISDAVNNREIEKLAEKVEPAFTLYDDLKRALSNYRNIGQQHSGINFKFEKSLTPGSIDPQVIYLRRFLIALGDYAQQQEDNASPFDENIYGGTIVEAVKRFQLRHGLETDGIIGRKTIAVLNTPISFRIHQIELALERLRWLPAMQEGPLIAVNIPSFQLWAFDFPRGQNDEPLNMKVVVGEAYDWQTPIFKADMHYLYFRPYWNVPKSIVREEILPKVQQDALYLANQNMELVDRFGSNATPVEFNEESIGLLTSGALRVRQRPGPRNALGQVKFIFPNRYDVYMHDTPAQSLFKQSRRDFSHGCIRVEKPEALAEFALKRQAGWNREKIKKAMARKTKRVQIKTPIPVIIFYSTAIVNQGVVSFLDDIYGLDKILSRALLKNGQN